MFPLCKWLDTKNSWHSWVREYQSLDSCLVITFCRKCGKVSSTEEEHSWVREYQPPDSCMLVTFCCKCEKVRRAETEHIWATEYYSPDSCIFVTFCRACKDVADVKMVHRWGQWQSSGLTHRRVCLIDGEIEEEMHSFDIEICPHCRGTGEVDSMAGYYSSNPTVVFEECVTCGGTGRVSRECSVCGA